METAAHAQEQKILTMHDRYVYIDSFAFMLLILCTGLRMQLTP